MAISWLHLSDLHIDEKVLPDLTIVLKALWSDLKELRNQGHHPTLIFFTGDIANSGQEEQYKLAQKHFFEPLLVETGLPKERLFWVPGNHDVDFSVPRNSWILEQGLLQLGSVEALNRFFDNNTNKDGRWKENCELVRAFERLYAYAEFTRGYFGNILELQNPCYFTARIVEVDGLKIGVAALNSAWRCSGENKNALLIGERQVDAAAQAIQDADIKFALMHHSTGSLKGFDRTVSQRRLSAEFDFILQGHLHDPEATQSHSLSGRWLNVTAGSIFKGRFLKGYAIGEYDFYSRKGRLLLRRYYDERREFAADLASATGGIFYFDIPRPCMPQQAKARARYEKAADAYEEFFTFLLERAVRERKTQIGSLDNLLCLLEEIAWYMFQCKCNSIDHTTITRLANDNGIPLDSKADELEQVVDHRNEIPLLIQAGEDFQFIHGSFLDYFIAKRAIKRIRSKNVVESLAARLHNVEIMFFLRGLVNEGDCVLLKKLMGSSDCNMKTVAIDLYRHFTTQADMLYLEELFLKEPNFRVRNKLVSAMFQNYRDDSKLDKYIRHFKEHSSEFMDDNIHFFGGTIQAFQKGARERLANGDYENKTLIYIYMLNIIGEEIDISRLEEYLNDSNEYVKREAEEAINSIRNRISGAST